MAANDNSSDDGSMEMYTGNNRTAGQLIHPGITEMQIVTNGNDSPAQRLQNLQRVKSTESQQLEVMNGEIPVPANIDTNDTIKTNNTPILIAYKIVLHILLLYAVIGVTYLLFIQPRLSDDCKCSQDIISSSSIESEIDSTTEPPLFI